MSFEFRTTLTTFLYRQDEWEVQQEMTTECALRILDSNFDKALKKLQKLAADYQPGIHKAPIYLIRRGLLDNSCWKEVEFIRFELEERPAKYGNKERDYVAIIGIRKPIKAEMPILTQKLEAYKVEQLTYKQQQLERAKRDLERLQKELEKT